MKFRSLLLFLALFAFSICAAVHICHQSGFAAAFACWAVLDAALLMLASGLFGIRASGSLFAQANTLGTLAATGVFHDALALTLKRLPFLKRMASDIAPAMGYKGMPFNVAQTLKNYQGTHTISDRSVTGTYAKQAGFAAAADQTFLLNYWPYISFSFTLIELNQMIDSATNSDARQVVISKLWSLAFNQLATGLVNRLLGIINAGDFTLNSVFPAATNDYKKLGAAVDVFLSNDTLMEAPDAILSIASFRTLANSLTAIANPTYGINDVISRGIISENLSGAASVSRFNLNMPADAANGILFDPMAVVFANRIPLEEQLPNDTVYLETITDPETGFSVLLREAKDPMTGEVTRTITTLADFAKGLQKHLVRLTEA